MTGFLPQLGYELGWLFLVYAVGGVVVEVAYSATVGTPGFVESRAGILFLPLNPLYGIGGVAGSLLLVPLGENPIVVFVVGVLALTAIEYLAGAFLERFLDIVAWDYSAEPLNFRGRICARYAAYWGLLALALVYLIDPAVRHVVGLLPRPAADIALVVVVALVAASTVVTVVSFVRIGGAVSGSGRRGALTSRIANSWIGKLASDDLIIDTFPTLSLVADYSKRIGRPPRRIRIWPFAPTLPPSATRTNRSRVG